jgi:hypothetical protein
MTLLELASQPLFDFDASLETPDPVEPDRALQPDLGGRSTGRSSQGTWREVPQARFLSWPPAMQMAYCRARDLDSAEHAENDAWWVFYVRRAESYA